MIVGDLRNKVDSIWDTIWTGGITNPITAVEQRSELCRYTLARLP